MAFPVHSSVVSKHKKYCSSKLHCCLLPDHWPAPSLLSLLALYLLCSFDRYRYIDCDTGSWMILFAVSIWSNLLKQKMTSHLLMVSPVSGCNLMFSLWNTTVQPINRTIRSVLHAYWLTDADEINWSFGHLSPTFSTWHFSMLHSIDSVQLVPQRYWSSIPSPRYCTSTWIHDMLRCITVTVREKERHFLRSYLKIYKFLVLIGISWAASSTKRAY